MVTQSIFCQGDHDQQTDSRPVIVHSARTPLTDEGIIAPHQQEEDAMYYTLNEVANTFKIPTDDFDRFIQHAYDVAITYPNPDATADAISDRLINNTTAESVVTSWYYKTLRLSPATLDKKEQIAAERIAPSWRW